MFIKLLNSVRFFPFCLALLVCEDCYSNQRMDYYISVKKINKNYLLSCAETDMACKSMLGYAFLFGTPTNDSIIDKDLNKAEYWLEMSSSQSYSRLLLGELIAEKSYRDGTNQGKRAIALIQSSCDENLSEGCMMMSSIYHHEYYALKENDLDKAVCYLRKSINILENKKDTLKSKDELRLTESELKESKNRLALLLIENGDAKGVAMLEKLELNNPDFTGEPLGDVYSEGKIVPQDLVKAYMYYDLSGGDKEEKAHLVNKMTSDQIKEALERSWNWQEQHHSYRPGYRNPADYDF